MVDMIPSMVTAKNMDFFRGEPNTKFKPAGFDDGQLSRMKIEDVKAFVYPAEPDALMWARWGGSAFEMNMHRNVCTNAYNRPIDDKIGLRDHATHEEFFQMIVPSFPTDAEEEDFNAIFRRTDIIWFTDFGVYFRPASALKRNVARYAWPDSTHKDVFQKACRTRYEAWEKGVREYPAGFQEDVAWSQALLKKATRGEDIPMAITVLGSASPFYPSSVAREIRWPAISDLALPQGGPSPLQAAANTHSSAATVPAAPCGTLEDAEELQRILNTKLVAAGISGETMDLITPPSSPKKKASFCGTAEDADELNTILGTLVEFAGINGAVLDVDDEDVRSPPRTRPRTDDEAMTLAIAESKRMSGVTPSLAEAQAEHIERVRMGLPTSALAPVSALDNPDADAVLPTDSDLDL